MAMGSTGGVKRRIRVNKNRKKNWNKVCDVKDVEDFLEDKRFEERIGGSAAKKHNDELFFLQSTEVEPVQAIKIKKPLRCFQNLGAFSKVAVPVQPNITRYSKRISNRLEISDERRNKKVPLRKHAVAQKKSNKGEVTEEYYDLWSEGVTKEKEDPEMKELINYRDEITKKRGPKVPCYRYQKPSLLPVVEVPHAGSSYNPSFEDHQNLLLEAVKIEEKKEKEELHLKRVLTDMYPTRDEAPTKESILKELSQGLFDVEEEPEKEESNIFITMNPPVTADDRLPRSRKRKRKELKEEARQKALEKLQNKRLHDIFRLSSIKSQIRAEEKISEERQAKKFQLQIEKMYKPRTLSKYKYEEQDLEVNLTEELRGSLRVLKTEGNLLEDRYKSLQRRNMIETRVKQKFKRKYKLKVQVKRSHRDFE